MGLKILFEEPVSKFLSYVFKKYITYQWYGQYDKTLLFLPLFFFTSETNAGYTWAIFGTFYVCFEFITSVVFEIHGTCKYYLRKKYHKSEISFMKCSVLVYET